MADKERAGAVFWRLSRVQMRESQLVDMLETLATADATDQVGAEAFARMSALAASHMAALEELAGLRGSELDGTAPTVRPRDADCELSELLEDAITATASAVVAYGALYAAARLMYEIEVCDLADAHAADWARELAALNDLLAPAVHADLLSEGLTCRCVCPACGIGACGCTRNCVDTIRGYSGQSQLEPSDGLELRIPPRPGSQLAEAGLELGDRIISVDGQLVHTNPEIQRALRGHAIGESMAMKVVRAGESWEIRVARVSDLPS